MTKNPMENATRKMPQEGIVYNMWNIFFGGRTSYAHRLHILISQAEPAAGKIAENRHICGHSAIFRRLIIE